MKKAAADVDSGVVTHTRRARRYPAKIDIALLVSCIPQAQAQLTRTAETAKYLGLIISVPKTEYMTGNCAALSHQPIHHVTDFKYLGSKIASATSKF